LRFRVRVRVKDRVKRRHFCFPEKVLCFRVRIRIKMRIRDRVRVEVKVRVSGYSFKYVFGQMSIRASVIEDPFKVGLYRTRTRFAALV